MPRIATYCFALALLLPSALLAQADPLEAAVQRGDLAQAKTLAEAALAKEPGHPKAHLVMALVTYLDVARAAWFWQQRLSKAPERQHRMMGALVREVAPGLGQVVSHSAASMVQGFDRQLGVVGEHLEKASVADISFVIQPAALVFDLSGDGRITDDERAVFEVEYTPEGALLPAGDPRRRPSFRLDIGDIYWARAYISFQQAIARAAGAYDIGQVDFWAVRQGGVVEIPLRDASVFPREVKPLILSGIKLSGQARAAYLAETDDDREWVPNPRQRNAAVPLPVDAALYVTWEKALKELELLVQGKTALDLDELSAGLSGLAGKSDADLNVYLAPIKDGNKLDLGQMLENPRPLELNLRALAGSPSLGQSLRALFPSYLTKKKPASKLLRLVFTTAAQSAKAKAHSTDGIEKTLNMKARYLLWLN